MYPIIREEREFALTDATRWMKNGFVRCQSQEEKRELLRNGQVFPSFVAETAGLQRFVVDYKRENECLKPRGPYKWISWWI